MLLDQLDELASWANTPGLRATFGPLETYLQYDFEVKVYFALADCPQGALVIDKTHDDFKRIFATSSQQHVVGRELPMQYRPVITVGVTGPVGV